MCWLLKHNGGRNPHTEVQYMVYLSSAPHSYAVVDSAMAVSWRKLQKTTSPGPLHGRYPTARLWARRNTITLGTAIEAECPADKQPTGLYICQFDRTY